MIFCYSIQYSWKALRKGFIKMVSIKPFIPVIEAGFTTARASIKFGKEIGEGYKKKQWRTYIIKMKAYLSLI